MIMGGFLFLSYSSSASAHLNTCARCMSYDVSIYGLTSEEPVYE